MGFNTIKKYILKFTPKKIKYFLGRKAVLEYKEALKYSNFSYAQEGEDLIINRFLENKNNGFYVDIGAHHPQRFSNTYNFYEKGWKGINIDAMPGSMQLFNKERPRDINLEMGISNKNEEIYYYIFNEPALNTFSIDEAKKKNGLRDYKIIDKKKISTFLLKEVFDKYLDVDQKIDFMTIDVEGFDLEVLESNDWNKYRPTLILIEELEKYSVAELISKSIINKFLENRNYHLVGKTFNTLIFKENNN